MSTLTVGDIRKAIKDLPDSAPIFNDVLEGPDEYTVNVVGIEGGIPERWKGVGNADEVKPGLWIHTEIIPMEEESDADAENEGRTEGMQNAARLLASMGHISDAVADFLRSKGIKGQRDDPHDDPICRFLKAELGTDDVAVEFGAAWIDSQGQEKNEVRLPDAVGTFIDRFDEGDFGDLEDLESP